METTIDHRPALKAALEGKVHEDLKKLYEHPVRQKVPWLQFPAWARPCDWVEGGHEG